MVSIESVIVLYSLRTFFQSFPVWDQRFCYTEIWSVWLNSSLTFTHGDSQLRYIRPYFNSTPLIVFHRETLDINQQQTMKFTTLCSSLSQWCIRAWTWPSVTPLWDTMASRTKATPWPSLELPSCTAASSLHGEQTLPSLSYECNNTNTFVFTSLKGGSMWGQMCSHLISPQ